MALSQNRVLMCGVSPFPYEQEAIAFAQAALPDTDPYRMWALVDLVDTSGRRYDIDLLVLGRHALYLVEIKSYPGQLSGDTLDWIVRFPSGHDVVYENPMRLANHKAKVLGSLLERRLGSRRPFVQPLIFLSAPGVDINRLDPAAAAGVVKRETLARALTQGSFPGADSRIGTRTIDAPTARDIQAALRSLGVAESKAAKKIGQNVLGKVLEDGPGYQDREAHHERMPERKSRVRSYLVPQATSQEGRDQLLRAAEREARVLTALGDHRSILRVHDYQSETPLGCPCILFEHWDYVQDLHSYLRHRPTLSFGKRVSIIQQVGEALGYCHRKRVLHRGLCPGAVLVREPKREPGAVSGDRDAGELEVRLYNFQLATLDGSQGTSHLSALSSDPALVYRAPEVIENPGLASEESDTFSLGALAYFVLTGRDPGADLRERQALLDAGGGGLSVAAARDDLDRDLDEIIGLATSENPLERMPVQDWLSLFLDVVTAPEPGPSALLDPLAAKPGDALGDLLVERILGSGSTARVLRVRRGDNIFALKVALDADLEERLEAEAAVLRRLDRPDHHPRIVTLKETLRLGDKRRLCLLLTDAGETLADLLAKDGPQSLDYALRWGEDLLQALGELEDRGIQHRDIKPANLGVLSGASKRARHLLLFDFSLSSIEATKVQTGTPAYRDPFMLLRGQWDEAADRYAAAVTLYELLTGLRPRFGESGAPATAAGQEAVIEAERFDATVRGRLLGFFRKALSRDVDARHKSAADMRTEWMACFATVPAEPAAAVPVAPADTAESSGPAISQPVFERLTPATPVEALPLSVRARNALDRSGVMTVADLLALPHNQLSLIRGVGRETSKEILAFAQRCKAALPAEATEPPLHAGYRGIDSAVSFLTGLSPEAAAALEDAGLSLLSLCAAAPAARVERVLRHHAGALLVLKRALGAEPTTEPDGTGMGLSPATVEAWIEGLLPAAPRKGRTALRHARLLLGLEPLEGRIYTDATELARALGVSRQMVYASLNQARELWRQHPHIGTLCKQVETVLVDLGGAAALPRVAEGLTALLPHDAGAGAGSAQRDQERGRAPSLEAAGRAQALVRIAGLTAEVQDNLASLVLGRLHERQWLGWSREHLDQARVLGELADALALRDTIASSEEVSEALLGRVKDTVLGGVPADRLVVLAAEASQRAARSARLELYPRGLAAERALRLSAGALSGDELKPADIVRVVMARYPDAQALPERPVLDSLLAELKLDWDEQRQVYVRGPALRGLSSYSQAGRRRTTVHGPPRPTTDPEQQEAREFEERLQLLVRRRHYRVLRVSVKLAEAAVDQLRQRLGVKPCSVDRILLAALDEFIRENGIDAEVIYQADRDGPDNAETWERLLYVMERSALLAADRLLSSGKVHVLTEPGLVARYKLRGFLNRLLAVSERDDGPALLLIVPSYDDSGPPMIDSPLGAMPVPTTSGASALWIPEPWVMNVHRAGPAV